VSGRERDPACFEELGYTILPEVLEPSAVRRLSRSADQIYNGLVDANRIETGDRLMLLDLLGLDQAFIDLIDLATVLSAVTRILGWNIQIYHTHLSIAPPVRPGQVVERFMHSGKPQLDKRVVRGNAADIWGWHRDGGRLNYELGGAPQPRVSVKVGYLLSDALTPDSANMYVVPGSHLDSKVFPDRQPWSSAQPILGPAGSAVIFDRRLFHSPSPNWSAVTRQVFTVGYSYRWLRPRDEMSVDLKEHSADPVRLQLLGAGLGNFGYSSPIPGEVPLKAWLERRGEFVADPVPPHAEPPAHIRRA
jgi:ectoine hydroxylase